MNLLKFKDLIIPEEINNFSLLKWNLYGFKMLGMFVTSDQKWPITRLIFGRILIFIYTISHVLEIISLFTGEWTGVQPRVITIAVSMAIFINLFQCWHFIFNQKKFGNVIISADRNVKKYLISATPNELKDYKKYLHLFEIFSKIVIGFGSFLYVGIQIDTFYRVWTGYALSADNIFKLKAAPFNYVAFPYRNFTSNIFMAYVAPVLMFFVAAVSVLAWRMLVVCLLGLGVFQLKAFNMQIQNCLKFVTWNTSGDVEIVDLKRNGIENYLKHCVKEQMNIKIYLKELESLISAHSFLDILIFSILICFIVYQLLEEPTINMNSAVQFTFVFSFVVFNLLNNGLAGEITEHDNYTTTALYLCNINWYEQPLHIKRIILIIMKGSLCPLKLKAFAIDMQYSTFLSVLKGAFSYLTVLRGLDSS